MLFTYYMNTTYFLRSTGLILLAFISLLALGVGHIVAAEEGSAGVGIVPALIDPLKQFQPGESDQFSVKVSNLSEEDQTYFLSTRDIIGVRDGGVPVFANGNSQKTGYELSEWITLSTKEISIPAGGELDVPFIINIPETATPGAYFGSVIISVEAPTLRSSGASIGYEVANIITLRIAGDVLESARIRQFSTSKYIYGTTNVEFSARIENEGNTLVKPTGPLEITNMFGKRVAQLKFNESMAAVFPKTANSNGLREYQVIWEDESPGFGRYEALLSVAYGSEGKMNTISSTVTFWILPMNIIGPALIILALLFLVIYIAVKIYVKRSMMMANGGSTRRLVRSRRQGGFPTLLVMISMLALVALFFIILLILFA